MQTKNIFKKPKSENGDLQQHRCNQSTIEIEFVELFLNPHVLTDLVKYTVLYAG